MSTKPPQRSLAGTLARYLGLPFVLGLLSLGAYTWLALKFSYSNGERAGFMQKMSYKGWVCKTWEGELSLVAMPGAAPEKFHFSVLDDAVAARINAVVGQRVALTYEEHKGLPTNCFGDTDYFVTDVKVIAPPSTP